MLIFRYLVKEVFVTLLSITTILLLIFLSNQFVRYLNRAALGQIPLTIIMKLMMLELPNLISLLLPLGFYMALLLAYGRLYADSEMIVLQACGYGPRQLLKHSYFMAVFVALIVLIIMLFASPLIATERAKLLRTSGIQTLIQTIVPGRFTSVSNGRDVFYVESMNRKHSKAENILLVRKVETNNQPEWKILWAEKAFAETNKKTDESYLILTNGHEYQGVPGLLDYQIVNFKEYKARLPHPQTSTKDDIRTLDTKNLLPFFNADKRKAAELQWRLSIPLMVLTLTLIAVPLSRVNPRSGKFARLLPAIILYIFYANFMFVGRNWIVNGTVPLWVGLWWLHILIFGIGLFLVWSAKSRVGS